MAELHGIDLFVIRKRDAQQYWLCSSEHGSGWNDKQPKQTFSKSELAKEVFRLIEKGWFVPIVIERVYLNVDHLYEQEKSNCLHGSGYSVDRTNETKP